MIQLYNFINLKDKNKEGRKVKDQYQLILIQIIITIITKIIKV